MPISVHARRIGIVNYKSYKYDTQTDKVIDRVGYSSEAFEDTYRTDLIIPFMGVEFPVSNMFTMFLEHNLYTHSDLLDAHVGADTKRMIGFTD